MDIFEHYDIEIITQYCEETIPTNQKEALEFKMKEDSKLSDFVKKFKNHLIIEKKLENNLNPDEVIYFENKLKKDTDFKHEYEQQKDLFDFISENPEEIKLPPIISNIIDNYLDNRERVEKDEFKGGEKATIQTEYIPYQISQAFKPYHGLEKQTNRLVRVGNRSIGGNKIAFYLMEPQNDVDCSNTLELKFSEKNLEPIILRIKSNQDKIVLDKKIIEPQKEYIIDITTLKPGRYYLQVCYPSKEIEKDSSNRYYAIDFDRNKLTVSFTKDWSLYKK